MGKDRDFNGMLIENWQAQSMVCVGLDSDYEKIPDCMKKNRTLESSIVAFNAAIIDSTKQFACAFKPNRAFYVKYPYGMNALRETIAYIRETAPNVPVIFDAKVADIDNTNLGYIDEAFKDLKADAITVHNYLGRQALQPFLDQKDKGIIVLCRTSNPGSGEFQDLLVDGIPLYQRVAINVFENWNKNGNCSVVVGATYPEELGFVRKLVGDMNILIPGIGAQGGNIQLTLQNGLNNNKQGAIINNARGIIFASSNDDFADVAREKTIEMNNQIILYRAA